MIMVHIQFMTLLVFHCPEIGKRNYFVVPCNWKWTKKFSKRCELHFESFFRAWVIGEFSTVLLADASCRTFLLPIQELFGKNLRLHAVYVFLSEDSTYLLFFCLIKLLEIIFFPFMVNCSNLSWKVLLKNQSWSSVSFTDHSVLCLSTLHNECLVGILLKHHLVMKPEEIPYLTRSDSLKP